jgi:nitroimidazol reductase NimA-like FMN-containing flavoprotein (pyridoxamine 5'-phosphate oxidase superfamily)
MASSPTTTLDARYSASDATPTTWEETRRVIEVAELFWLTTVRSDGRPHVTPVVAVWADEALHFSTGPAEQKGVNLRSNPHVILTTGSNGWESGLDVVVEGDAVRTTEDEALRRLAAAWTRKWDGRWQYGVQDGCFKHPQGHEGVFVFSVVPMKVLAFAKGSFSHTRHDFQFADQGPISESRSTMPCVPLQEVTKRFREC